ncbi:hypothetical protein EDD16DRAFT_1700561 [Pisolithus croceorrhizus]|nr:hypothetical protein EDD16DRAFT_1700561 [Pisolithus croceorrhizus]
MSPSTPSLPTPPPPVVFHPECHPTPLPTSPPLSLFPPRSPLPWALPDPTPLQVLSGAFRDAPLPTVQVLFMTLAVLGATCYVIGKMFSSSGCSQPSFCYPNLVTPLYRLYISSLPTPFAPLYKLSQLPTLPAISGLWVLKGSDPRKGDGPVT